MITYQFDDKTLTAERFLPFVNQVWPGNYDWESTQTALKKTINITACDGPALVGCLRILSDGYYFGTITELLVLPQYQRKGIGKKLLRLLGIVAQDAQPADKLYFLSLFSLDQCLETGDAAAEHIGFLAVCLPDFQLLQTPAPDVQRHLVVPHG